MDNTAELPRTEGGLALGHEFDGWSRDRLETELQRLTRPNGFTRLRRVDTEAGAPQRAETIRAVLSHMEARGLASWPPPKPESNYSRRVRESIEREDVTQFDAENEEPATDFNGAFTQREKALAAIDKAIDQIARAVPLIRNADDVILNATAGRKDLSDAKMWLHMGHVAEHLQRRLGDAGVTPDLRDDKSVPSPRMTKLAGCHNFIRTHIERG